MTMTIRRYARERLRPRQTLPAVALVTAAAAAIAAALIVTFRIWDDLADRAIDAVAHPNRLSTRPESIRPLAGWAATMGIATAAILWWRQGAIALGLLAALTAVLASSR